MPGIFHLWTWGESDSRIPRARRAHCHYVTGPNRSPHVYVLTIEGVFRIFDQVLGTAHIYTLEDSRVLRSSPGNRLIIVLRDIERCVNPL